MFRNKKIVAGIAAIAGIAVGTTAALAYLLAPGSGSTQVGGGTVATPAAVTLTPSSFTANTVPITIGCACHVSGDFTNPAGSGSAIQLHSASISTWSSNVTGCDPGTLPNSFAITSTNLTFPLTLQPGADTGIATYNFTMQDDGLNQTACEGAVITLTIALS